MGGEKRVQCNIRAGQMIRSFRKAQDDASERISAKRKYVKRTRRRQGSESTDYNLAAVDHIRFCVSAAVIKTKLRHTLA